MSHYWKILIGWFLSAVISLTTVFYSFPLQSFAVVPSNQIVHRVVSSWGAYDFDYSFHNAYFTIADPTGLPTSTLSAPYYFYKNGEDTFDYISGADLISAVLTRGISVVMNPSTLSAVIRGFLDSITSPNTVDGIYVQGGLYDSLNNFYGYCLDDLEGCHYYNIPNTSDKVDVLVPSETTNNVYNYFNYYLNENYDAPDFINVIGMTNSFISQHQTYNPQTTFDNYFNFASTHNRPIFNVPYYLDSDYTGVCWISPKAIFYYNTDPIFAYVTNSSPSYTSYDNFCYLLNLDSKNNTITIDDLIDSNIDKKITYNGFDSTGVVINRTGFDLGSNSDYVTTGAELVLGYDGGLSWTHDYFHYISNGNITIYKDLQTYNNIINDTYSPTYMFGDRYYSFDSHDDNSFRTTYNQIDNSQTVNQTIYENISEDYSQYVENNYFDNDELTEEITIIINNYYPTVDDDPEGPDNPPVDPDNPSGGGDDDPDIDNEGVLDAILDALARFFRAIGKILATILAGLLEVVDTVLEAVAGIMENFTGITDFLGALFSWLPSPIPEVIGAGVSICILFAIFRFIRG